MNPSTEAKLTMAEPGLEGVLRAVQPGTPKIREVRHTDAGDCAHVYLRSRAFALRTVPVAHEVREVRRWMADEVVGRTDMWVAEIDGTVVGLMVLDHDETHLHDVAQRLGAQHNRVPIIQEMIQAGKVIAPLNRRTLHCRCTCRTLARSCARGDPRRSCA